MTLYGVSLDIQNDPNIGFDFSKMYQALGDKVLIKILVHKIKIDKGCQNRDWHPLSQLGSNPFLSGKPAGENINMAKTRADFTVKKVTQARLLIG